MPLMLFILMLAWSASAYADDWQSCIYHEVPAFGHVACTRLLLEDGKPLSTKDAIYYNRGNWSFRMRQFADAKLDYTKALQLSPRSAPTWQKFDIIFNRGIANKELGLLTDAIKDFKRARKLRPEVGDTYYNLGIVYEAQRRYRAAREHYQKATRVANPSPEAVEAFRNLAKRTR